MTSINRREADEENNLLQNIVGVPDDTKPFSFERASIQAQIAQSKALLALSDAIDHLTSELLRRR